jgi:hypothetical protein
MKMFEVVGKRMRIVRIKSSLKRSYYSDGMGVYVAVTQAGELSRGRSFERHPIARYRATAVVRRFTWRGERLGKPRRCRATLISERNASLTARSVGKAAATSGLSNTRFVPAR